MDYNHKHEFYQAIITQSSNQMQATQIGWGSKRGSLLAKV